MGAKLFQAVGRAKLRESTATVRLRLAVEYVGEPPDAAFFCGRREQLIAISDNADVPIAEAPGIATAVFETRSLGFRGRRACSFRGHASSEAGDHRESRDDRGGDRERRRSGGATRLRRRGWRRCWRSGLARSLWAA
jgi:hypothetical protein